MKIIITVIGQDKVGIVAQVSAKLAELNINIIDISQTLMQNNFTMILMGETASDKADIEGIQSQLTALGGQIGVDIRTQRQEIFDAIQKL
ncbi:MAG: ACT domain-containing protein [Lactobacillus sp.]|jgi:ACT domain-containing protein|nr:ACT domain-containing protein [Lactobacillus sp.]